MYTKCGAIKRFSGGGEESRSSWGGLIRGSLVEGPGADTTGFRRMFQKFS